MKEFIAKKIFLTNLQHFELSNLLRAKCILLMLCRYIIHIWKMCMKEFNAEKMSFDKINSILNLAIFRPPDILNHF